jgi:hypothetical protein
VPIDDMEPRAANDDALSGRDGLAAQLRDLEAFVARSDAAGDSLPPEAHEMIARLREIVAALDGLTASLGEPERPALADDAAREQG